jgi:RNA polymerase sigma-70 factor (ECF subfamily)
VTLPPDNARNASSSEDDTGGAETELVTLALSGDAAAFERLLAPQLPRAFVVARRVAGSSSDAEDLVQDACLRALEQLHRFTPGRPFGPWFLRLLINLGLNKHKAARIRANEPLDEMHHASSADPVADLEASEFNARFTEAVEALSPRQRVVVMMFEVDGHSGAEIAETLGISADTVRWHLHEARAALRTSLRKFRGDDTGQR